MSTAIEFYIAGDTLLTQAPGVSLFCPAKVVEVTRTEETATVTLDNGQQLMGKLLVAAYGSGSFSSHKVETTGFQPVIFRSSL